jgi:hypothetical protein
MAQHKKHERKREIERRRKRLKERNRARAKEARAAGGDVKKAK